MLAISEDGHRPRRLRARKRARTAQQRLKEPKNRARSHPHCRRSYPQFFRRNCHRRQRRNAAPEAARWNEKEAWKRATKLHYWACVR